MKGEFTVRKMLLVLQKYFAGNIVLEYLEEKLINELNEELSTYPPPTFIIGPPRTGSTLLYQMLVANYGFSYFSNFSAFFYKSPALITRLTKNFFKRYDPDVYESSYGLIPGIWSPSEAGQIYRYWFSTEKNFNMNRDKIKKTIPTIIKIQRGPFIWKNLDLSMKVKHLLTLFPDAVFIHSKRNPIFTAQSLLIARRKRYGDYRMWFGIKSPNYEEILKKDPFEQVVLQVKSIDDYIEKRLRSYERYFVVEYEKLCENPQKVIYEIVDFLNKFNIKPVKLNEKYMDVRPSNKIRLKDEEFKKLLHYINKHYGGIDYEKKIR